MKVAWVLAGFCLAIAAASVVPMKGERKLVDAVFLKRQKDLLDLLVGLGHTHLLQNQNVEYDFVANSEHFTDPTVAKKMFETYKRGMLPADSVFAMSCPHVRHQFKRLFDVLFFAKDFDTFYAVAKWAKHHIHPVMFSWTLGLALHMRDDTRHYSFPPLYEIFPNYFVPQAVMHDVFDHKMAGIKHGKFEFNTTGFEYNYHHNMLGGQLNTLSPHNEYKLSYFREDVGLSNSYVRSLRLFSWMRDPKYNVNFYKYGERFYYIHQQLLARYTLERLANGLPYVTPFSFHSPISVGYNPKISHVNGQSFLGRPDHLDFVETGGHHFRYAQTLEERIYDSIDDGGIWNHTSQTFVELNNDHGFDLLGQMVSGFHDDKNPKYYGSYYYAILEALGFVSTTKDNYDYNGGVTTMKITSVRDPVFYNILARMMRIFQRVKGRLHPYMAKDLKFPGVSVTKLAMDKLVTYFDHFDFEVTNGVAVSDDKEYIDTKYQASQFRLNHKPFTYKITVNSDAAHDGIVRVFVGPKYDSEHHRLTVDQKRMSMFEIDRFLVKINAGETVFERNSKESPIFNSNRAGFRELYSNLNKAINNNEPYYVTEKFPTVFPDTLQLPMGWESGLPYTFVVVVSPVNPAELGQLHKSIWSLGKLDDGRSYGFPFDRPIWESEWNGISNIHFHDESIYHKEDMEINRA